MANLPGFDLDLPSFGQPAGNGVTAGWVKDLVGNLSALGSGLLGKIDKTLVGSVAAGGVNPSMGISVLSRGAVGDSDGIGLGTDDTVAFQQAFADAFAAGVGVIIPPSPTGKGYRVRDTVTSQVRSISAYDDYTDSGNKGARIYWDPITTTDMKPCFDITGGMYGGGVVSKVAVVGPYYYGGGGDSSLIANFVNPALLPSKSAFTDGVAAFRVSGSAQPTFENCSTKNVKYGRVDASTNGHISSRDCNWAGMFGVYVRENSEDYYFQGGSLNGAWAGLVFGTRLRAGHYGGVGLKMDRVHQGFSPYAIYQWEDSTTPPANPSGVYGQINFGRFEQVGEAAIELLPNSSNTALFIDSLNLTWSNPEGTGWNSTLPAAIKPRNAIQANAFKLGRTKSLQLKNNGDPTLEYRVSPYTQVATPYMVWVEYLMEGPHSLTGIDRSKIKIVAKDIEASSIRYSDALSDMDIIRGTRTGLRGGNLLADPEVLSNYLSVTNATVSVITLADAITETGATPGDDLYQYLGRTTPVLKITPTNASAPSCKLRFRTYPYATERLLFCAFAWFGPAVRSRIWSAASNTFLGDVTRTGDTDWKLWQARELRNVAGSRSYNELQFLGLSTTSPTYIAAPMVGEGHPRAYSRSFHPMSVTEAFVATAPDGSTVTLEVANSGHLSLKSSTAGTVWTSAAVAGATNGMRALTPERLGVFYASSLASTTRTLAQPLNQLVGGLSYTLDSITIDALQVTCSTAAAGSVVRLGIYASSSPTSTSMKGPWTLLADAGTVDTSSTGIKTLTLSTPVTVGADQWFMLVAVQQGSAASTLNVGGSANGFAPVGGGYATSKIIGFSLTGQTGALPATLSGMSTSSSDGGCEFRRSA